MFSVSMLVRSTFKLRHRHAWRTLTILGKSLPFYWVSFFRYSVSLTEVPPISTIHLVSHQSCQSLHLCYQRRSTWGTRHAQPPAQAEHHSAPRQILQWKHLTSTGYSEIWEALKRSIHTASNFVLVQNLIKPKIDCICIKKSCLPQRSHAQQICICRHNFV